MKLKNEKSVEIFINGNGSITLLQDDHVSEEVNLICLSPDQFRKLGLWFDEHYEEIIYAWNDGIELEVDDETDS